MPAYQVTVRYGGSRLQYHTFELSADDLRDAMTTAAAEVPDEIVESADLVELRAATDPDDRSYVGG